MDSDIPENPLYTLPKPHASHVAHVRAVGPGKPLGYVNYADIEEARLTPAALRSELEAKGRKVLELPAQPLYSRLLVDQQKPLKLEERIRQGFSAPLFYVYDEAALAAALSTPKARETLDAEGWPHTPEAFVRRVHEETALPKTPLFDLISDAFGSKQHGGRTDRVHPNRDYEDFRKQPAIPHERIPPRALDSSNDLSLRQRVMEAQTMPEGSKEHYLSQIEAEHGQPRKDWRDLLQEKQQDKNNGPDVNQR